MKFDIPSDLSYDYQSFLKHNENDPGKDVPGLVTGCVTDPNESHYINTSATSRELDIKALVSSHEMASCKCEGCCLGVREGDPRKSHFVLLRPVMA